MAISQTTDLILNVTRPNDDHRSVGDRFSISKPCLLRISADWQLPLDLNGRLLHRLLWQSNVFLTFQDDKCYQCFQKIEIFLICLENLSFSEFFRPSSNISLKFAIVFNSFFKFSFSKFIDF